MLPRPGRLSDSERQPGRARPASKNRFGRYGVIVLTWVIGAIASLGMFSTIRHWQSHVADIRFTSLAADHLQTINAGLKDATDLLYSMRAYFESLDHRATRAEYQRFSHTLRERVVGLRDTGWAPRVTGAERAAFEQAIQASGVPDFQIRERNAEGKMDRAAERDEYFPILYSDPGEINRPIMGFDLNSEPMRHSVIVRARVTDRPAATSPVKLMNMQRPNGGLMSFIPVNGSPEPNNEAPLPIAGVVLGAFETAPMIENILATKLHLAALDMYVFDPNGPRGNRMIYWHSAGNKPAPAEDVLLAGPHWQGTLELVDQQWGAIFVPLAGQAIDWTAISVLIGGLLMTGSIVGYLWVSLHRTLQLERLTTELRKTTEELRRNGAQLDHLVRHDSLTGLPNRTAFRDTVATDLRGARFGHGLAVLYLDLDRFKAVNDTLGHPVGDQLLCQVALRLRQSVRETDTIARLGGDEFAIVQTGPDQPHAAEVLACRLIETLSRPYEIDGQHVVVGASIGITLADHDDRDVDQMLRRADMALYAAKRNGRGTWRSFEPAMDQDAQTRRGLEMGLRQALERDELVVHYQPQVNIADGRVRGFEALLRWQHPDRGLVLPGAFIRCAEETGLIAAIGARVLTTALHEASRWPEGIRLAVNLSPYQLARDDLAETVEAALVAAGQPGSRLELEITETALIEHHAAGHQTLSRLRKSGVHISMDDFGTGYASLSHLRSFPFDRLKIDRSFVAAMTDSPEGAAIVRAILQLAATLDIATTAEGVETAAQLALLAADGCDEAQGFLFSAARPASEVIGFLTGWPADDLGLVHDAVGAG